MPKPTAQAMRAVDAMVKQLPELDRERLAALIDKATRLPALIEALEFYADKWTHATVTGGPNPVVRDSGDKARAALQDAEGSSDE